MANAATAKRGAGLKCSNEGMDSKHSASASAGRMSSAAAGNAKQTKRPTKSAAIELAPSDAPLSEKRRIAALISWQKRRKGSVIKRTTLKSMQVYKRKSSEISAPVTPPPQPAVKRSMQKQKAVANPTPPAAARAQPPPAKRKRSGAGSSGKVLTDAEKFSEIRREAAKLGWERRRIQLAAAAAAVAAKAKPRSVTEIRREAAKLGWEKRKKLLAAESSMSGLSTLDDSSSADEDTRSSTQAAPVDSPSGVKASTASRRKTYSASSRRKAAILGWEKRRSEKAERMSASPSPIPYDTSAFAMMLSKPHQSTKEIDNVRHGIKRSRRLADDSSDSYEDEVKRIAQLVAYLRVSRGWIEFQPSSRLGSGTAIQGFIPSSIATFIRNGTISQRTVLEHGTLGVHYALDWDGYGGLKDMLATFGEDYAPYPTEEMLEQSRVTEWELGEDLPWKEWAESEEEKLVLRATEKQESIALATNRVDDMEEMMHVAKLLANLDRTSAEDCSDTGSMIEEDDRMVEEEDPSTTHSASSSGSSDQYNDSEKDCKAEEILSNNSSVVKACETQWKGDDLITQPHNYFQHWNFGLC
ncbi:hypothetical protein ACHAWU_001017 [Discostella pseudostelligera]|jgi:hypothetical protein|uniref:Uncharacterized protein n=1 Tax=Discostella pseudostelligera TaxID=259834 RepID=A0ABD3MQV1_9STRA